MRAYCQRALRHLTDRQRADLDQDELFQDALLRCLTVIGETAFKLSKETQARFPLVPWLRIAAFRHVLVHDYGSVNLDRVWEISSTELTKLDAHLGEILREPPADI